MSAVGMHPPAETDPSTLPLILPFELELDFFRSSFTLVLNIDGGIRRYRYPLAGHLNAELFSLLKAIGQASQLCHKLFCGVSFFNIASGCPFSDLHQEHLLVPFSREFHFVSGYRNGLWVEKSTPE